MTPFKDAIESALPHVKILPPTTVMPVQLYGTYGDERFIFYWKRLHAQLDVGSPAANQPFSAEAQYGHAQRLGQQLDLPSHTLAPEVIDSAAASNWIEVEPRLTASMETSTEERADLIAEVFMSLNDQLTRPQSAETE